MKTSTSLLLALTLLLPATALAVPQTVGFSARLADNGRPVTGTHAFTFKVFDAETGGTELWGEAKDLAVADGVVTTALGDTVAIDTGTLFTGLVALYLEVAVDGVALSPRMALQSVPFALRAQSAAVANYAGVAGYAGSAGAVAWENVTGKPSPLAGLVCSQVSNSVSVAASAVGTATVYCTDGYPTGGGAQWSGAYGYTWNTHPYNYCNLWFLGGGCASWSRGWQVTGYNLGTGALTLSAWAICCKTQ